ncbi:Protein FAM170A [Heterocephalus glaber]|uniref:Protein FAM170A n=1 Tax=Heterocephalus glaber TaxID=10181 RepID=G5AX59_HETGA|nr:Protein FAM170A [Heterocephalus glaber]
MSLSSAPQPGCSRVAKVQTLGAGEMSSPSEYFSCVSSPFKLSYGRIHRVQGNGPNDNSSPVQLKEGGETPPASNLVSFSSCSSCKTCVNSVFTNKEETSMKIYYIEVKRKNLVAFSWEAEETSASPGKQPRMEEVTFPEGIPEDTPPSDVSTRSLLSGNEPSGEENKHKTKVESDNQPGSSAVEETPRARAEWDLGGLQLPCLPSYHDSVEKKCGVSTQKKEEEQKAEQELKQDKKEHEEEQSTEEDLVLKKPWNQCPGYVFHSPEEGSKQGIGLLRELCFV